MSKYAQRQQTVPQEDGNNVARKAIQVQQCDLIGTYSKLVSYITLTPKEMAEKTFQRQKLAEDARAVEHRSAVLIQALYRGIIARRCLKKWKISAIVIQKAWRNYSGQVQSNNEIRNLLEVYKMNFYNDMATKVQKTWRGYYVRKHVHDFYARKRYFQLLDIKNQIVRRELAKFEEQSFTKERFLERKKLEINLQEFARKKHYLVSTYLIPGIYNSPFRKFSHEMESRLRNTKPLSMKPRVFPKFNCGDGDTFVYSKKPHPPGDSVSPVRKRLQGPFKSTAQVREQRYRPFNPSLRASTDYRAVENARMTFKKLEWSKMVDDLPFTLATKSDYQHERCLHTDSDYLHDIQEKNKFCTRLEKPEENISNTRMQTVVSSIPVFDRLGQTYTKGAVLLQ